MTNPPETLPNTVPTGEGPPPPPPPAGWDVPVRWPEADRRTVGLVACGVSLVPVAFALLLVVIAPGFLGPLLDSGAAILGLPPVVGFALVLAVCPVLAFALARARGPIWLSAIVAVIGVSVGLFVVILSPAIILIAVNLQ